MPSGSLAQPGPDLRGRRRSAHLDEHFAKTSQLIGVGPEDDQVVARSRGLLRRHVDDIVDEVYRRFLAHPETAVHFSDGHGALADANGDVLPDAVEMRREAFRAWLVTVIEDPLGSNTSEYVAAVGHAHVRQSEPNAGPIKAGFLLITISWVQSLFLSVLVGGCKDTADFAEQAAAWCRRLMLHLDLLLAVYGSTERSAHWY
jgi:hypothetical protein